MSGRSAPAAGAGRVAGPLHAVLLGTVARRFYVEGASKVEIARDLDVSRFKVARLLEEAVQSGFVRIEIGNPGDLDLDLSARLADALGLRECLVIDTDGDTPSDARARLGAAAAAYLSEVVIADDVLGLPWAREVYAMVQALTSLAPVDIVQMCGAQPPPGGDASAVEVVVHAARVSGGRGHVFYAPLLVDDEDAAATVRRQSSVAQALEHTHRVTRAIVGVGSWGPGTSTVYDSIRPAAREELRAQGIVGEVSGVFFDADGRIRHPDLERRVVSLGADALLAIPHVCGLVLGPAKAPAVRAVVRGGIVDSLIVDSALGRALLDG